MKFITKYTLYILLAAIFAASCTKEAEVGMLPVISGLESEYIAAVNQTLELKPTVKDAPDAIYSWLLNGVEESAAPTYTFKAPTVEGKHTLVFRASTSSGMAQKVIAIEVGKFKPINASINTLLTLQRPETFPETGEIAWTVTKATGDLYRMSYSETGAPSFIAATGGRYNIRATLGDLRQDYMILARAETEKPQTPYISHVFDYMPAPGQFVNDLPKFEEGDTREKMIAKVAANLAKADSYMISLGGWGGYVVFGFDHTIPNVEGKCDFRVLGNAFGANDNKRPNAPFGGSCEPGVIMVAYDKNKNGKPDEDEWYEINGSGNFSAEKEPWYEFVKAEGHDVKTIRNYEMTYYRPATEKTDADYDGKDTLIKKYFRWTDNQGVDSFYVKNKWHPQSYYPLWIKEDKLTFKGVRLAQNGINEGKFNPDINEQSRYYVLYAYRYGYADNNLNLENHSGIDIDWAITKDGKPANLPGIDFVKVITGVNQVNGWLGENSTEVAGAHDLHMMGVNIKTQTIENGYVIKK